MALCHSRDVAINKAVRAADDRNWLVQSRVEWREPATAGFEHDMASAGRGAAVILSLLLAAWVIVVAWFFAVPGILGGRWLVFGGLAVIVFFLIRWVLRRPRTITAETPGGLSGLPAERWTGMVRGLGKAREETRHSVWLLETSAIPGDIDSPLRPTN